MKTPELSDAELERYSRHIMLDEIGLEGQARLKEASVLLVGVGGLGCPAAHYLAAAGVGALTVCDGDQVELANLQRQLLYDDAQIGMNKAEAACLQLQKTNPHCEAKASAVRA
ncbi:MAG: ThiF family adenylyltransferase, partial [Betaproteobacteria bacterium AqS2]|nr:ThiF family adenylyltransferase [Betaproteobacteria bacterium AqS2]